MSLNLKTNNTDESFHDVELVAIRLLARREHSELELARKLALRDFSALMIQAVIKYCLEHNYLSNFRYTQMFLRTRAGQGYGLYRIALELKSHGIISTIIDDALRDEPIDWFDVAAQALKKHARGKDMTDFKQRNKTYQFLQRKGFSFEKIGCAFDEFLE